MSSRPLERFASVFGSSEFHEPDDVRGDSATRRDAVRGKGWPVLDDVRGQVFFGLDHEGPIRNRFLEGRPTLQGRAMFATVEAEHPLDRGSDGGDLEGPPSRWTHCPVDRGRTPP